MMPIHVRPVEDLIAHELSDRCPCGPTTEPVPRDDGTIGWLVIHHSLDGRERYEQDRRAMHPEDIANRFDFHPATTDEKRDAHTSVRQGCRRLADQLNEQLPDGREKSLAITHLEEAMFWGNAALARHQAG